MCGIVGIYAYHASAPPVDRKELLRIRDHMFRRGPDGEGLWLSDAQGIGFGHRRLAIIDLSPGGAQPMHSADGRYVITYNGEIYNYRELRRELEARGFVFRTQSDTEVLLHLYADRGERMLDALRGMFAFGLWDNLEHTLFLARDAFGIKPLYYADDGKTLRFASQVKALLAGGAIDTTPEPAGHTGFYLWGSVPEPYTLYRGIRALPAGHMAIADEHGLRKPTAWCSISEVLGGAAQSPARGGRQSAIAALAAVARSAISAHTIADVPVGVFLSAGLDSALVASAAITKAPQSFTLTLGFEEYAGTVNDEVPLAEEMARMVGAWHTTLMVSRKDFEAEREKLLAAMDQPSIDGVNTWFIARAAAHMELKVALSGLGGDELFASYPSFSQVPKMVRYCAPLAGFPGIGRGLRHLASPVMSRLTSPKYAGLLEYGKTFGSAYLLRRCLFAPWELSRILDPDLVQAGLSELQCLKQLDSTTSRISNDRLAVSALEMSWYMRNQLLRDSDWAGMAQSLEIRVPFVDLPLLREAAPWLAAHPDINKAEIAAAAAPNLPAAVLKRPKTGFSVPVRDWLLTDQNQQHERGLRGWARYIHGNFVGSPA